MKGVNPYWKPFFRDLDYGDYNTNRRGQGGTGFNSKDLPEFKQQWELDQFTEPDQDVVPVLLKKYEDEANKIYIDAVKNWGDPVTKIRTDMAMKDLISRQKNDPYLIKAASIKTGGFDKYQSAKHTHDSSLQGETDESIRNTAYSQFTSPVYNDREEIIDQTGGTFYIDPTTNEPIYNKNVPATISNIGDFTKLKRDTTFAGKQLDNIDAQTNSEETFSNQEGKETETKSIKIKTLKNQLLKAGIDFKNEGQGQIIFDKDGMLNPTVVEVKIPHSYRNTDYIKGLTNEGINKGKDLFGLDGIRKKLSDNYDWIEQRKSQPVDDKFYTEEKKNSELTRLINERNKLLQMQKDVRQKGEDILTSNSDFQKYVDNYVKTQYLQDFDQQARLREAYNKNISFTTKSENDKDKVQKFSGSNTYVLGGDPGDTYDATNTTNRILKPGLLDKSTKTELASWNNNFGIQNGGVNNNTNNKDFNENLTGRFLNQYDKNTQFREMFDTVYGIQNGRDSNYGELGIRKTLSSNKEELEKMNNVLKVLLSGKDVTLNSNTITYIPKDDKNDLYRDIYSNLDTGVDNLPNHLFNHGAVDAETGKKLSEKDISEGKVGKIYLLNGDNTFNIRNKAKDEPYMFMAQIVDNDGKVVQRVALKSPVKSGSFEYTKNDEANAAMYEDLGRLNLAQIQNAAYWNRPTNKSKLKLWVKVGNRLELKTISANVKPTKTQSDKQDYILEGEAVNNLDIPGYTK
jgi:hypothetical protein